MSKYNEKEKYYLVVFTNGNGIVFPYDEGIQVINLLKSAKKTTGYGLHNIGNIQGFEIGEINFGIISETSYLKHKVENLITDE